MLCVPKECLSKSQAGLFMTVFNSVSLQHWFQRQLEWWTISGQGFIKPSTCFIPFLSPVWFQPAWHQENTFIFTWSETLFFHFFSFFFFLFYTLKHNKEFSCRSFEFIRFIGNFQNIPSCAPSVISIPTVGTLAVDCLIIYVNCAFAKIGLMVYG